MEVVDPEEVRMQRIHRDWGCFFSGRQQLDIAALYYNLSLDYKDDDPVALYNRSACFGSIAAIKYGLKDARKAMELEPDLLNTNLQYCDTWFAGNEFEKCLDELFTNSRKFSTQQQKSFQYRTDIVEEVMLDCLGDSFRIFANENWKILPIVFRIIKKEEIIDDRPQFKILKELDKCDVVSILEKEIKLLHPREVKRRRVCYETLIRTYFNKSAGDVLFLESLLTNPAFALKQSPKSSKILSYTAKNNYEKLYKFMKMLQTRSPIYNEKLKKCPNKKLADELKENYLLRVTHRTRNLMFKFLEKIKKLRKEKNIKQLAFEIEEWMSKFVNLKIDRILPRKLEFMHHILNTLGLAYLDQLEVPDDIIDYPKTERLQILFKIVKLKDAADISYIFGDKSTFVIPDRIDYAYIAYKKGITRLEIRYKLAKYNIEKLYLQHEIAIRHAHNCKFKDCYEVGLKLFADATKYDSPLWLFLSDILKCHANAGLYRIEKLKEDLDNAYIRAREFEDPRLNHFFLKCIQFNNIVLKDKDLRRSQLAIFNKDNVSLTKSNKSNKSNKSIKSNKSNKSYKS